MNLVLDNIIFGLQPSGGISVYWAQLLNHFMGQKNVEIQMLQPRNAAQNLAYTELVSPLLPHSRVAVHPMALPTSIGRLLPARMPDLPAHPATIFHSSYYRPLHGYKQLPQVVTVHDFTFERFAPRLARLKHSFMKNRAIAAAQKIICVSENTRDDLFRFVPSARHKLVEVVYNGVDKAFCKVEKISAPAESEGPYVLYVGARAGYKNFNLAVKAVARHKDLHFRFVGGGPLTNEEAHLLTKELPDRYTHLLGVSTHDLNVLYNNSFCLLYPSSYEGFGIPVLEAFAAHCPVVALSASSIPEIAANAALLVNHTHELADALSMMFSNEARAEYICKGAARALQFSWDKCAKQTLEVYAR